MSDLQETWTDDGGKRFAVIDYSHHGVCEVSREVMHMLLERAGFTQAPIPAADPPTNGLERLRRIANNPTAEETR